MPTTDMIRFASMEGFCSVGTRDEKREEVSSKRQQELCSYGLIKTNQETNLI
jgi:hypothetical protein